MRELTCRFLSPSQYQAGPMHWALVQKAVFPAILIYGLVSSKTHTPNLDDKGHGKMA